MLYQVASALVAAALSYYLASSLQPQSLTQVEKQHHSRQGVLIALYGDLACLLLVLAVADTLGQGANPGSQDEVSIPCTRRKTFISPYFSFFILHFVVFVCLGHRLLVLHLGSIQVPPADVIIKLAPSREEILRCIYMVYLVFMSQRNM